VDEKDPPSLRHPRLTDFLSCADFGADEVLRLVASAERVSDGPLASAIVEAARERGVRMSDPTLVEHTPGEGIHAVVDGHELWIGSKEFAGPHGFTDAPDEVIARHAAAGKTALVVAIDGRPGAVLAVEGVPRGGGDGRIVR